MINNLDSTTNEIDTSISSLLDITYDIQNTYSEINCTNPLDNEIECTELLINDQLELVRLKKHNQFLLELMDDTFSSNESYINNSDDITEINEKPKCGL